MHGLIQKTLREVWWGTLLVALALAAVQGLLAYVLAAVYQDLSAPWLQIKFVQVMFQALLGTEVGEAPISSTIASMAWVHPIVLALVWLHGIMFCTRVPAGEVDRGTIDVLLSLPISRTWLYSCESTVWLAAGLIVVVMGWLGNLVGTTWLAPALRVSARHSVIVSVNLYALYLAVGGMTWLASSLSSRRGHAVGIVLVGVLASFLLNSLAPFWHGAQKVAFLSVMHYFRPLLILRDGVWPIHNLLVLGAVAVIFWVAGACIFARRDIATV